MNRLCKNCLEPLPTKTHYDRNKKIFCSDKCQHDHTENKWKAGEVRLCLTCESRLVLKSSWDRKNRKFCNASCAASFNNKGVCRVQKKIKITNEVTDKKIRKDGTPIIREKQQYKNYVQCEWCGKTLKRKRFSKSQHFCTDTPCQNDFEYHIKIDCWKLRLTNRNGHNTPPYIKRYIFEKYGSKCQECGWHKINPVTGKTPLTIEHEDGDAFNDDENNLKLLCPNCHSLTPTYCGLNKGKGRKSRRNNGVCK